MRAPPSTDISRLGRVTQVLVHAAVRPRARSCDARVQSISPPPYPGAPPVNARSCPLASTTTSDRASAQNATQSVGQLSDHNSSRPPSRAHVDHTSRVLSESTLPTFLIFSPHPTDPRASGSFDPRTRTRSTRSPGPVFSPRPRATRDDGYDVELCVCSTLCAFRRPYFISRLPRPEPRIGVPTPD